MHLSGQATKTSRNDVFCRLPQANIVIIRRGVYQGFLLTMTLTADEFLSLINSGQRPCFLGRSFLSRVWKLFTGRCTIYQQQPPLSCISFVQRRDRIPVFNGCSPFYLFASHFGKNPRAHDPRSGKEVPAKTIVRLF